MKWLKDRQSSGVAAGCHRNGVARAVTVFTS